MRRIIFSATLFALSTLIPAAPASAAKPIPWSSVKALYMEETEEARLLSVLRRAYAADPDHEVWRHPELAPLLEPGPAGVRWSPGNLKFFWWNDSFNIELGSANHHLCFTIHFNPDDPCVVLIEFCE